MRDWGELAITSEDNLCAISTNRPRCDRYDCETHLRLLECHEGTAVISKVTLVIVTS